MTSLVPVYSAAKPLTAAAAFLTLDLDAEIGSMVPDLPRHLAHLRLRDLLAHRSGLDDYGAWPDYHDAVRRREEPWDPSAILGRAEVGEAGVFRYSNIGYLLVRLALEEASGRDLFDLLDSTVLGPLGIEVSPFSEPAHWDGCDHPSIGDALRSYHPGWVYTGTFVARPSHVARGIARAMAGGLGDDLARAWRWSLPVEAAPAHPLAPDAGYGLGVMTHGDPVQLVAHG